MFWIGPWALVEGGGAYYGEAFLCHICGLTYSWGEGNFSSRHLEGEKAIKLPTLTDEKT